MTADEMTAEFSTVSGNYAVKELVHCLTEACSKDPQFSMAAAADSVLAFESLVRAHTNAREDHITTACQLFSAAIFNASTNVKADIRYLSDEES